MAGNLTGEAMTGDAAAKIAARLTELWRTSRPTILERMTVLHAACASLVKNPADSEARHNGLEAAHKLSGVLGIFGLPQGSELAGEIESQLKSDQPFTVDGLTELRGRIADLDAVIASRSED
jgi:HPt (histidine-containing phosphotransfer) domain-containing protein